MSLGVEIEVLSQALALLWKQSRAFDFYFYRILDYCIEAEVYGVICFGMGVTLRKGNREYFYSCLDRLFPGMKEKYIRTYGMRYVLDSPRNDELMKLFHNICESSGILHDNRQIFEYLSTFEDKSSGTQLSLFDARQQAKSCVFRKKGKKIFRLMPKDIYK